MISVISVYNDNDKLQRYLLKGLKRQSVPYELILLDNTDNKYPSAASALNEGGRRAKGDYLMFVHQDVELLDERWLEKAEKILNEHPEVGIAGVAGRGGFGANAFVCHLLHGEDKAVACRSWIEELVYVQTIDECVVIVKWEVFNRIKFDESCCIGWHLYGVDISLSAILEGYKVAVLPLDTYHASIGYPVPEEYFLILKKLLRKHRKEFIFIYTTVGNWTTFMPVRIQRTLINWILVAIIKFKRLIKNMISY